MIAFSVVAVHTAVCKGPLFLLIYTGDNKFLCQGEYYDVFPTLPDDVEVVECQSQSLIEFPTWGTFKKTSLLLTLDISNGSLETLDKDTFEGAKSPQYFNADHCNLQGEIPRETFCDHTPDLRFINLSNNPNYVFTSKPFECLKNLDALWIDGTIQNCNPDTVWWINELPPDKAVMGDKCHPVPLQGTNGKFKLRNVILKQRYCVDHHLDGF